MKKQFLLVLLMMLPMVASAHGIEVKNDDGVTIYYKFIKDSTELEVTYRGNNANTYSDEYDGNVVIPEEVTYENITRKVTSIGFEAFYGCSKLTSVTIPKSVTSIGKSAFMYCSGLTSVTIPKSVTDFGSNAFFSCSNLTSVHITDLAAWCNFSFPSYDCNPLFYSGKSRLFLNGQEIKDLVIPDDVTSIGDYAFYGHGGLTSITIPSSLTSIGSQAFNNCPRLKHIYVASSTPTDCYFGVFDCNGLRDKYDIYNYAILHVPMGSKEEYAAAYEWRYFLKIKEDLDINGQTFYTTLSVNQAGDGYVKHYVKADEPYTLYIGSEAGMHINTVTFNGEDVTDQLIDGYYTTPNITSPSKIVVSFEQNTNGIASVPADDNLHVYGCEGSLYISGVEEPQVLSVYTLDGKLTSKQMLESDTKIKLNEGIYIVKVGERTFKVSL